MGQKLIDVRGPGAGESRWTVRYGDEVLVDAESREQARLIARRIAGVINDVICRIDEILTTEAAAAREPRPRGARLRDQHGNRAHP